MDKFFSIKSANLIEVKFMKIKAEYVFEIECAEKSLQSIIFELEDRTFDRSSIELFIKDSNLVLNITSKDLTSMRSALNTWLRLIQITQELHAIKKDHLTNKT